MNNRPPKWADRFLSWYCNPELLEEIKGDTYELYVARLKEKSKRSADLLYVWDVLRFFRWSNIKRTENGFVPGAIGALWSMNFTIALLNPNRNNLIFVLKPSTLPICLTFPFLLTAHF